MTAKEIIQKAKALFAGELPPAAPLAAPALAAPVAPPAPAGKPYKLEDGTDIVINQAGEIPAVGDVVLIAGAPAAAGVITLEDKSTITVGEGGVISQVSGAEPVTQDLSTAPVVAPPVVQAPVQAPVQMSAPITADEFTALIEKFWEKKEAEQKAVADAAKGMLEKHEATISSIFEAVEKLAESPTADPKTLTGNKKDRFDKQNAKEERLSRIADALKKNKEETK